MPFSVHVDKRVLRGFIRRALKVYPAEYMESIIGRVQGLELQIVALQDIPQKPCKDKKGVPQLEYDINDLRRQAAEAHEDELILLGTIHSHPHPYDYEFATAEDMRCAMLGGEAVCGIVPISEKNGKRRAKVIMLPVIKPFELIQH